MGKHELLREKNKEVHMEMAEVNMFRRTVGPHETIALELAGDMNRYMFLNLT